MTLLNKIVYVSGIQFYNTSSILCVHYPRSNLPSPLIPHVLQKDFHLFKEYIIIFYLFILSWPIDYSVFTQQPLEEEVDSKSFDAMEQSLLILSETKASLVSTMSLWKQQVYTIAKFHFLTLRRESKSVRSV